MDAIEGPQLGVKLLDIGGHLNELKELSVLPVDLVTSENLALCFLESE